MAKAFLFSVVTYNKITVFKYNFMALLPPFFLDCVAAI